MHKPQVEGIKFETLLWYFLPTVWTCHFIKAPEADLGEDSIAKN